jgi:hypothetical protein
MKFEKPPFTGRLFGAGGVGRAERGAAAWGTHV